MKARTLVKFLFIVICLISVNTLYAQKSKTVKLTEAGSLSSALTEDEKLSIASLTIVGKIDLRDIDMLNEEMPRLSYLDMGQAKIMRYSLESTVYPDNELPSEAFMYNKSVKKIVLPQSLKTIGYNSFKESYIEEVVLGESLAIINDGCFSYCDNLKKINIPSSVKQIGKEAFAKNGNMKEELAIEE